MIKTNLINQIKYYIITNDNKIVYFGAAGYSDFTIHKDEARKQRYIDRHKNKNLNIGINQELIHLVFGIFIMAFTNNNCKL
jgi:hypothetical protein